LLSGGVLLFDVVSGVVLEPASLDDDPDVPLVSPDVLVEPVLVVSEVCELAAGFAPWSASMRALWDSFQFLYSARVSFWSPSTSISPKLGMRVGATFASSSFDR
jgi:hypothetical protein